MTFSQIFRIILDYLLIIPVSLLPQHFLSKQMYRLTRIESVRFRYFFIKYFCKIYKVDLEEAKRTDISDYQSFNDFFTRSLKKSARKISRKKLISPVDGEVVQAGEIKVNLLYQIKNFYFSLEDLLGENKESVKNFYSGQYTIVYLSPKDYHRIHMPCKGKLISTTYIPGRLYPVNHSSTRLVGGIFARNERLVCYFATEFGKMAMIFVGAIFVGSIETVWSGQITPPYLKKAINTDYKDNDFSYSKGEEVAKFNMGSTVVLVTEKNFPNFSLGCGDNVKLNQAICE